MMDYNMFFTKQLLV